MKKYYYSLIAATAMLFATTSCSQDEELVPQGSSDVTTFKVELQGATGSRAAGDGKTVDILYYEVHQNGKIVKDLTAEITNGTATVNIPLLRGEVYDIIFWAQKSEGSIYNATDLTNIQVSYNENTKANKEAYDAFFNALDDFKATNNETTVQLRRPFAQLNIGTIDTDWTTAKDMIGGTDAPITTSEVTVKGLATNFNALTGLAAGEADVTFHQDVLLKETINGVTDVETFTVKTKDAAGNEVTKTYYNLAMNYLLVPGEKVPQGEGVDTHIPATTEAIKTNADVTATFWRGDNNLFTLNVPNVTIQRNYRTNIYGTLLSENKTFEIEVAPIFDGDHNKELTTVNTDVELEQALRQDEENIVIDLAEGGRAATGKEYQIKIGANEEKYYFGKAKTKTITINANGNTINFVHNNTDWNYIRCINDDTKWIINDAYLTNSNKNDGPWNRHDIRFYNAVELNNVTSDKAIALLNDGKLKNVTISDLRADNDDYGLWITAQGQTVELDACTFNMVKTGEKTGRGIAIKDQYVDENVRKSVTLNVKNTKFNTQRKAAVLVTSTAGAVINWGEGNDISGVTADPVNAVWVDEDYKNIEDVTVNGASVVVEGSAAVENMVIVATADELKNAINNANAASAEEATTIYLKEGTYTGAFNINQKNVVLTSNGNATIDGLVHGLSAKIAINKLILTNVNAVAGGVAGRTGADYYCLGGYAADWIIENCTFNVSNEGQAAGKGAINIYANNNDTKQELDGVKYDFILKNCVFNCNGERPIRGKINSYIEGCTFNDQYRYSIQVQGNVLDVETVTFINNKIVNPCQTSEKEFAAGIQISGSQICEGVTFNISGNTMQSNKFMNLLYVYDDSEQIKIESCTINGATFISETEAKTIGTIAEATEITLMTAEDLVSFANAVNGGKQSFAGKTVKLGANIDLAGIDWEPIGQTGATTFNGVFDGQNYTIFNLSVDSENETGANYASGLFGWVESHTANHGHIKNVKIENATIKGHHCCGALVGYITQGTALVENCHVTNANVSCTYANKDASGDKAGALIGNATVATPVKNCTATESTISAARDAGQLIGAGKEANVTECTATNVTVKNNNTGTGANIRNEVIGRLLK